MTDQCEELAKLIETSIRGYSRSHDGCASLYLRVKDCDLIIEALRSARSPYGKHQIQHEGITLECNYFVPGLTLHDLTMIFEKATKSEGVSDLSGNPSNWPTVRGVIAVAEACIQAFESRK